MSSDKLDWELTVKVRLRQALLHDTPNASQILRRMIDEEGGMLQVIYGWCEPEDLQIESVRPYSEKETRTAWPALTVLDKIVTVCGACERACCWQGTFMCDSAEMAGIKNLTVRDLHEKPRGENPEYWFKSPATGEIDRPLLEIYQHLTRQVP